MISAQEPVPMQQTENEFLPACHAGRQALQNEGIVKTDGHQPSVL